MQIRINRILYLDLFVHKMLGKLARQLSRHIQNVRDTSSKQKLPVAGGRPISQENPLRIYAVHL